MADVPVVPPHLSHFMQVPFRTRTKLPHLLRTTGLLTISINKDMSEEIIVACERDLVDRRRSLARKMMGALTIVCQRSF